MKVFIRILFSVILFSSPTDHILGQSQKVEIMVKNFRVSYSTETENLSRIVIQNLETYIPQYEVFFDVQLKGIILIQIPESRAEYQAGLPERLPIWSNGFYSPLHQTIILKRPEWYMNQEDFGKVLRHELAHAYFHSKFHSIPIPLWLNEGLAEYLSGEVIGIEEGVLLSNAMFSKNLVTLSDIDSLNCFNLMRARLAYLESLTAITFLEKKLRENDLTWDQFFDLILEKDFDKALKQITSFDVIDFEIAWYRWLEETYRWFLIFNWENLIWLIIIIILLGSLYAIRYRNRKILLAWETQENSEKKFLDDSFLINGSTESERGT
ncbi:MAG: hypothetical protein JSW33_10425 [bacterium]|nr:MAG: hypothetical protein JSW33_10425 [bacterium]